MKLLLTCGAQSAALRPQHEVMDMRPAVQVLHI
jgi:hypothetical protein